MLFHSTRSDLTASPVQAIIDGISPDGGLYVPECFPQISINDLLSIDFDYPGLAAFIMTQFVDIPEAELLNYTRLAYGEQFDDTEITPVVPLSKHESVLELWHGPTSAFKDIALQMLPQLMRYSRQALATSREIYILVATSGDTGKAALDGFCDVPGTVIQVFYPNNGVSAAQWRQMVTQEGNNVFVCGINGNFDDAQAAVKKVLSDKSVEARANALGYQFSSANSINFGRLMPQIVYYFYAYKKLCTNGTITSGDKINFCVPTGNFGNILAGYYAMRMGLPVNKLLCASNRNNVLTEFFSTGSYDSRRSFYKNMSCSIDILISSNLERLLHEICSCDKVQTGAWMKSLNEDRHYNIGKAAINELSERFYSGWCDEAATLDMIKSQFNNTGYLLDPHTAVGQVLYKKYIEDTSDTTHTVLLSTANPFKFASAVLSAFEDASGNDEANLKKLSQFSGQKIPANIIRAQTLPVLHSSVCDIDAIPDQVIKVLAK